MSTIYQSGKRIASIFIAIFCLATCEAQQLAFPGAEGFGRFTSGGRGGTVYYVTDTTDNASNPTMGSLRYGVTRVSGPRTILFKVSGTIRLKNDLKITNGNLTIAGQSAPGDGICIADYTLRVNASNVIIRYIRCRLGNATSYIDDAIDANGTSPAVTINNIIIDHCSMSWSIDEVGSFYDNRNFTLQWCILSESLFRSVDPKGDHGYGGIWGGQGATFHHNLIAHNTSRNPRFCGARYTGDTLQEIVDMRNNVLYNWGNINSAYGGEGGNYNIVNNYYKPGPATPGNLTVSSASNKRNRILNYTGFYYATDSYFYPDTLFGGKFYVDGNVTVGYPDVSADNWAKGVQSDGFYLNAQQMSRKKLLSPVMSAPVRTQTATDAFASVMDSAGAILPKRDTVDRRVIREARTGTATFEGTGYSTVSSTGVTHPSGIIDKQTDVGGWPYLQTTPPPVDTDGDGIPDSWETGRGLNPNNPSDRNDIDASGYTMLEVYLNGIGQAGNALPLVAVRLQAAPAGRQVVLSWHVTGGEDIASFTVEKGTTGSQFMPIAVIPATSGTGNNLSYIDNGPQPAGTAYYRLKVTCRDGSAQYSNIASVVPSTANALSVYPNPVSSSLTVSHAAAVPGAVMHIIAADGKVLATLTIAIGSRETIIGTGSLSKGSYTLLLENGPSRSKAVFLKE